MKKYHAMIDGEKTSLTEKENKIQREGEALVRKISKIEPVKGNETLRSCIPEIKSLISKVVAAHPSNITRLTVLGNFRRLLARTLGFEHESVSYLRKEVVESDLISDQCEIVATVHKLMPARCLN